METVHCSEDRNVAGLEDKPSVTVDKQKLKELLEDSKKYEERIDEYTAATANAFLAALTGAREIYENPDATQEEVNQAYVALRQAIFGLQAKAGTETTQDTAQNQSGSDGNSGKEDTKSAKTGDSVPVMLWMTTAAVAVMLIFRKKNR